MRVLGLSISLFCFYVLHSADAKAANCNASALLAQYEIAPVSQAGFNKIPFSTQDFSRWISTTIFNSQATQIYLREIGTLSIDRKFNSIPAKSFLIHTGLSPPSSLS